MPKMHETELLAVLEHIKQAFPRTAEALHASAILRDEWIRSLQYQNPDWVRRAVSHCLQTMRPGYEPTLSQFLESMDSIAEEERQLKARAPVVIEAPKDMPAQHAVPIEEVKALIAGLMAQFEERERVIAKEKRKPAGILPDDEPRTYRNGMVGPRPAWNPDAPMMSYEEAKRIKHDLAARKGQVIGQWGKEETRHD